MKKSPSLTTFILLLVTGAWLVMTLYGHYGMRSCRVIGESMAPTYHEGNLVLVSAYALQRHPLKRGDVIVFSDPDGIVVIKRVVGVPGDVDAISPVKGMRILGRDQYLVLGDNRTNSVDSSVYGPIHRKQIIGIVQ